MLRLLLMGVLAAGSGAAPAQSSDGFVEKHDPQAYAPLRQGQMGSLRIEQDCPAPAAADTGQPRSWNTVEAGLSLDMNRRGGSARAYTRYTCPQPMGERDKSSGRQGPRWFRLCRSDRL